ncbi:MAG: hypothetical protein GC190_03945 [Alphaproteobacteria bacterium]|nr:hypothetical protein [Alphaproteobacteria bacterium]
MNPQTAELIELTERLIKIVERELAILKGARPSALTADDDERATTLALYSKRCASFKREVLPTLDADAKKRLTTATDKLRAALKEESRLLARFRHVSEGLIKAIADEVATRQAPPTYAKAGSFAKPAAGSASAMTYNQTA